jgi:hypothetical protein
MFKRQFLKYLLTGCVILLLLNSCQKDEHEIFDLEGEYSGIYFRSSPNARYQAAQVNLVFEAGTFYGSSSISRYPAICRGVFTIDRNTVDFINVWVWTADFDWSYILAGEFTLSVEDDEIVMVRNVGDLTFDTYRLKKKKGDG